MRQPRWTMAMGGGFLALGLMVISAGCGDSGPPRYHISGKVTYGGQPVAAGAVMLVPDASQGNTGPAASVTIKDGQYDSNLDGTGHVGGPHVLKITGMDGQASPEFPQGMLLFPEYEVKADLPKEDSQKDVEVPSEWVLPKTGPVTNHGA